MTQKTILLYVLMANFMVFSQIKGKVMDENKQSIPFVNIQIENENIGTTSEENGTFTIHESEKNKNLIFSAIGFEKQIVKCNQNIIVVLKTSEYQLNEVVILKRFNTKTKEIGKTDNAVYQAFDNGPRIDTKFFKYESSYKKTKYIKQVSIQTDSKIDNASFKIHFYGVDANGFPGMEMLNKNLIVSVSKGSKKTFFNVLDFNLTMPKTGIFIGFEKLINEKNKFEKTFTDPNTNATKTQTTYFPLVMYNYVQRDFQFVLSGGQ